MAMNVLDGNRIPAGYETVTDISSATSLTVPTNARVAIIQATVDDLYWRDDGTPPVDATTGMLLAAGDSFLYTGQLEKLQVISDAGELHVSYYK